ncbi:RecQ family ATP-dependent DNA helicase [Bacteroidetes/Chlorobi group bacterium Naka2016]|jgi:ATP-dependent DNA helicase RecQ|nr:MAG: RecQ family ATP-dependent DNA helicase [Bacteroidetes/Chlorobi group bacterium Naka2016]
MNEIICPKCGSSMVLRTAIKGKNAGNQFYGCSRYPECKGIVLLNPRKENLKDTLFPLTLIARERFQNYQVRFFEILAVPEDLLVRFRSEDINEEILKAFSQWRIDFPICESKSALTEKQRQIISVLEKILTRGRITLSSPHIEKEFKEMFKSPKVESSLSFIEFLVIRGYKKAQKSLWLDSKEENIFYQDFLPKLLGENYEQFVLPQVEISSLLPPNLNMDTTGYQRVDFAIFHPKLKEKIIVEIDGEQHKKHIESDKKRDKLLEKHGYTVIRIPASEIRKRTGQLLSILSSKLSAIEGGFYKDQDFPNEEIIKFIYSIKIVHQIQIVILQAIQSGFLNLEDKVLWHIVADLDELGIFNKKEALTILMKSVTDFLELLGNLSKLYSVKLNLGEPICNLFSDHTISETASAICISFSDKITTNLPTFFVQNIYFPYHISNSSFPATPVIEGLEKPEEKDLEYFLQYLFRKPYFWEGQYDGITRALQGKDALLLLPTGAGKSLVFQLASLLLPGRTVVIDPIISLMEDQIDNLAMIGIDRCIAITSQIADTQDRMRAIQLFAQGEYLFAFIAPERFQTIEFRESLRTLTIHTPIALIVIDEAHCVSEWGHDFRTAYLNIGRTSREYCKSNKYIPPLVGLTGTASRAVLKDIQRELQIEDFDAIITPKSFDRKELKFDIIYSNSKEKIPILKGYLSQKLPGLFNTTFSNLYRARGKETYSGLVFCPHVDGEFGVERVSGEIRKDLGISTAIYSGREPKNLDSDQYRSYKNLVTKEFKRNNIPLLVCTKAFGMGIDKPNIRYTIHLCVPPSIESFYQEAGRAGRDRKTAYCCIIVSNDDQERTKRLLDPNTKVEEIDEIIKNIPREENDDITRVLYFHINAFRGIAQEKQDIEEVLKHLGDTSKKGTIILTIPDNIKERIKKERKKDISSLAREIVEKALYRLLLIGIVSDYTIDYSRNEFTVKLSGTSKEEIIEAYGKYVASYLYSRRQTELEKASRLLYLSYSEFILEMVNLLLHFIYDVIEGGRRRAFYEMLLACSDSPTDHSIRQRILRYLEATEYSEALEQIINDEKAGIIKCRDVFGIVRSPNESAELRGQVSRYLESYPDHPALLMLRSLSEIFSRDKNTEVVKQNFTASISNAHEKYELSDDIVFDFAAWAISNIAKKDKRLAKDLIFVLTTNRYRARILIEKLPIELTDIPAWFLLAMLGEDCKTLILKIGG